MFADPTSKSFAEIRQTLDPCCSYIIVEGSLSGVSEEAIRQAFRRLPLRDDDIKDARMYHESKTGQPILVARLVHGSETNIREKLLSQGIAGHMTLYYYGNSPQGEGHAIEKL